MTKALVTLLASSALCASLPLRAQAELDVVGLKSAIERSVESDYPKLDALYKDIHAHPEIAFQEEKTVGLKDQWPGTLMFIAQPAEEIVSGAKAMLADGLFTRFPKANFGFALHANGAFAYGAVLFYVGISSSNADGLYIKFRGRGGHGAVPQATTVEA